MPNTQFKVYHSSPLHTYKVQIHIHYRYIESIAFRYIPKHTRDPITQTLHFFTSAYLKYVKSPCKHSPSHSTSPLCLFKFYLRYRLFLNHFMPLHTYTANFATSSNVQLISNIPFTHLFVLIIYVITTHI